MTPQDEARFKTFIDDFVTGTGFDPPFHVVVIAANGSVSVQRHTDSDVKQICASGVEQGFAAPVVVAVIAPDGRGKAAKIEIEAAPPTMQ